ncbi:type II toxin-antitoxin system mRNA interferase toxin, RelE/StbE family [Candidatus Shapirobacteria bacterium]|nr:type II toxin-antitoxin system mRNA interferase toxin, RelE/StbE family [Candidatus Shapirobacteria bacterium]
MEVIFDTKVEKDLFKIAKKNKKLYDLVASKLKIFCLDKSRPSLRLHKLTGSMKESWSISINESIRMIFYYIDENTAYFVAIGKHEEVYKN